MKQYLPIVLLVAAALLGLVIKSVPLPDAAARLNRIPAFGPGFVSEDVPFSEAERKVFGQANLLRRRIIQEAGDRPFSFVLTVIDGTNDRHAVHDPSYCYRGAGWQANGGAEIALRDKGGQARLTHLSRQQDQHDLLYFYSDGVHRYASPLRYWKETTLRRLTFGASGPEPILVLLEWDARQPGAIKKALPVMSRLIAEL